MSYKSADEINRLVECLDKGPVLLAAHDQVSPGMMYWGERITVDLFLRLAFCGGNYLDAASDDLNKYWTTDVLPRLQAACPPDTTIMVTLADLNLVSRELDAEGYDTFHFKLIQKLIL